MNALICGISGQDGAYLAKLLVDSGYQVYGTSRDCQLAEFRSLKHLGIYDKVKLISMSPNDFRSVYSAFEISCPDEVYNLSGQSSVGLSFEQPNETIESILNGTLHILEAMRIRFKSVRFYNAGSSEVFGCTLPKMADELTLLNPASPYAVAKAAALHLVKNYRESYGLHVCTGILFNHESPFRPKRFVTMKIIDAIKEIEIGVRKDLILGRLDIVRDWGWAEEYVEAMSLMLKTPTPHDLVIATGEGNSLEQFVRTAFEARGLDWREYVHVSDEFSRPSDISYSVGNANLANELLGWRAKLKMRDVVYRMLDSDFH